MTYLLATFWTQVQMIRINELASFASELGVLAD